VNPESRLRNLVWWALRLLNLSLLFMIAGGTGLLWGTYSAVSKVIPQARDLGDIRPGRGCRILSAEGELLAAISTENREFLPLERIPKRLQDAAIAVEDKDFYHHIGVDPRGIMRAVVHDILHMGARQGGSTITQQLARNVYLTRSKTIARKLAELILALQLERSYTKSEILELYLNQIYFGEGAYGVQVAAKTYFGKDASKLSLSECALVAALPKAPEFYSPFEDADRASGRRNLVLRRMRELGYVTAYEEQEAQQEPLKLVKDRKPLGLSTYQAAPYFVSYVLRSLTDRYGPDAIYKGGLTIQTTLNMEMQRAAEEAVQWGLAQGRRRNVTQLALVAVDVRTGAIKAMVGGADWKKSQYNRAVQGGRQAGSSFKPFVYTAALEQGDTPDTRVVDSPISFPGAAGKRWSPRNYDGKFKGSITYRRALALSRNVPAVKVANKIGIGSVIATAERMGIYHPMQPVLPLAIGYCDVSPLEMASAFAVFSAKGMRTEPYGIAKIMDPVGRTLEEHQVKAWRVLDERISDQMVDMLSDVIKYGTAAGIKRQLSFPAAGKTGTSNDYKDAWFIGFTGDLSAAVWAGNDSFSQATRKVAGATIPAPVWARFMAQAQPVMTAAMAKEQEPVVEISSEEQGAAKPPKQKSPRKAPEPARPEPSQEETTGGRFVTKDICPLSGMLRGPDCPPAVQVTYDLESDDKPPTKVCDIHGAQPARKKVEAPPTEQPREQPSPKPKKPRRLVTLPICALTGKIATPFCPIVKNVTFDEDKAPTETCTRHGRRAPGP
jgi:penicillin-binding protein 1A